MNKDVTEFLAFRYEKLKLLKKSARGEVWLVKLRRGEDLFIIKRMAAVGLPYDLIKKFSFKLPAKVFYCAEDDSETIVVEEFIPGENLSARENFLSELEVREILLQMCDGLKELHEQNIIHRDIKPSNLILQGGRIRLIDFDAARIFKSGKEADTKLLGTKGFAPPEQYGGGQTDGRSDIYSLGVTMKILLGKNYGGRLKEILDRCTEFAPNNRFQNVDELKESLKDLNEPETESTPAESRRTLVFLAIKILLFTVRRKFHAKLIILTTGIFLLASASTLNSNENFTEEVLVPQVEKISEPQIISKVEPFQFPEIVLPPQNNSPAPSHEPPKKYEPPPRKIFSGLLKTKFYLNGALFNQDTKKENREKITRPDWRRTQARLQITNDTGDIWREPKIKFVFSPNWGGEPSMQIKNLPALNVGESADFIIPFDSYELPDKSSLAVCLQIYLEGDESKLDEHYWCVWFDIAE